MDARPGQEPTADRAAEHAARLLAREPVAGVIVDSLPEAEIEAIAAHPEITWGVLAAQPDRDAAIRLLEHRFQHALHHGELDTVTAALDSPELIRDAVDDPALEELVLRSLTALCWHRPDDAMRRYRLLVGHGPTTGEATAMQATCAEVLAIAPAFVLLGEQHALPAPLDRLVRLQWVASPALIDELMAALRDDMTADAGAYLAALDLLATRHPALLVYVMTLTERFLPAAPSSLGELDDDERSLLSEAISEIDRPIAGGLRFIHIASLAVLVGVLLSMGGYDQAALVVTLLMGGAGAGYVAWVERGMYSELVRLPLAAYLANVGTPTGCIVSWLLVNRKAVKKLKAFDVAIDADTGLAAIARMGRMARLHAGS